MFSVSIPGKPGKSDSRGRGAAGAECTNCRWGSGNDTGSKFRAYSFAGLEHSIDRAPNPAGAGRIARALLRMRAVMARILMASKASGAFASEGCLGGGDIQRERVAFYFAEDLWRMIIATDRFFKSGVGS